MDDLPRTIDEAEAQGWRELAVQCGRTMIGWAWLRQRTKRRVLAEIKAMLKCSGCGGRPVSVSLHKMEAPEAFGIPESVDLEI